MSLNENRIALRIDIFDKKEQQAQILPTLKPPELIAAILQEFQGDWAYLGTAAEQYELQKITDFSLLDNMLPIISQVDSNERLVLSEKEHSPPLYAARPSQPIYLREQVAGAVYKLDWVPAIIGRQDGGLSGNERLAMDLESYEAGLRVSRRHAQIFEENGQFYIESLSQNSTLIERVDESGPQLVEEKMVLQPNDVLFLERSEIRLKFLIRTNENKGDIYV